MALGEPVQTALKQEQSYVKTVTTSLSAIPTVVVQNQLQVEAVLPIVGTEEMRAHVDKHVIQPVLLCVGIAVVKQLLIHTVLDQSQPIFVIVH